jgi:hypothetical protein
MKAGGDNEEMDVMEVRKNKPSMNSAADSFEGCTRLKLLLLVTWKEEGEWYLYRQLKARLQSVEVLQPFFFSKAWPGFMAMLAAFFAPVYITLLAFARRTRFDAVFSWSMRMGVCYGILNRLFGSSVSARHILRDFHINPLRTDWRYRLRLALLRFALPGIDAILCTSRQEERQYAEQLAISPDRSCFFPDVPPSQFLKVHAARSVSDYIFACGNSDRDFKTLIGAVKVHEHPTVILSQQFRPREPLPATVRLISHRVSAQELQDLILGARAVVVPLEHFQVAAGQNSMLEAMALGRPVIVSENVATLEYARHGDTAFFFPAGDAARLAQLVQQVFADPDMAEAMGRGAHESVRRLLDEQVRMFLDIARRFTAGP